MMPSAPLTSGLMRRFGLFVEGLKRAIAEGIGRDHDTLGPTAVLLWNSLGSTLRRLAALHARFGAGSLASERRRNAASRPASDHPASDHPATDRPGPELRLLPPRLPPGAVLARYGVGYFCAALRELIEDAEMRALLEAAPQAGRLLRPLWRMLTADPLPASLRPPPRPRRTSRVLSPEPRASDTAPASPEPAAPNGPPRGCRATPAKPPAVSRYRPATLVSAKLFSA